MSRGSGATAILYGEHSRSGAVPGLTAMQPGVDFPYDKEILQGDQSLLLETAPAGTGSAEQIAHLILDDPKYKDALKLIVCSAQLKQFWYQRCQTKVEVVSHAYALRNHHHLKADLLVIEHPGGEKTINALAELASRAQRVIIRPKAYDSNNRLRVEKLPFDRVLSPQFSTNEEAAELMGLNRV